MKKPIMIIAALMLLIMPMMAERVTPETARKVATTFLQNNGAKTTQMVDLSESAGFENLYIFTTESSFVVMSADDCVQPILGYSLTGKFVTENMVSNITGWLQGYNEEIQYAIDSKMTASAETAQLWKDLTEGNTKAAKATAVVNALLQTTWDQNGIYYYSGGQLCIFELYNNLCPYDSNAGERTVTGCVATAMAQIMKYWGYPAQGIGSHSYTPSTRPELGVQSANFGATTYDWNNMPNILTMNSTETEINAIATLMYHCGVSVDMMYDISANGGSGAYSEDIPYALIHYFNYKTTANIKYKTNYTNNNWINLLKAELNASRPIEYNGSGSSGGHAFVCDGYDSNNNFHFNWGWSGQNDGFFALSSLNPGSGGAGGGGYNFTNGQSAVLGIEPASTLAAPTNLTYSIDGTNEITLNWTGVSNALSYNVYRNNNLISNTTSTTYSEIASFGTNDYFVRAVDSYGQLSLPSNTVTVTVDYQTPIVNDLTGSLSENNVNLSWTAPEWCYPETPSATMTYGDGSFSGTLGFNDGSNMYWGHRYPAVNLTPYNNMAIYKAAFYANETGTYKVFIYKGTNSNHPQTKVHEQSLNVGTIGWFDFDLSSIIIIDASKDYWVFMYDPEGRAYPATSCTYSGSNANYYASSPTSWVGTASNKAFLIKTYLTDGIYTYNLYQDGTAIVENLNSTTYNATLNDNATNLFTVKTNYYAGETDASNKVGFNQGTASLNDWEMASNDKMTLTASSQLTVSGTMVNANPDNLILENGAQLIHNTEGVKATVKKNIIPYTGDNGWNFIASPITEALTPSEENGFLNGTVGQGNNTYDLYYYYEPEYLWMNYETETFNLVQQQGYLYANGEAEGTTLQFAGTLIPSNSSVTIDNLSHSSAILNGFNLVGNPFACNATVDRDFCVIDNTTNEVVLAQQNAIIAPCEGVFVQASADNTSVTFSKANAAKSNNAKDGFDVVVTQSSQLNQKSGSSTGSGTVMDRARIRLGEGIGMEKFTLDDKHLQISLWQDGHNYAVAYTHGAMELPLNFMTKKDGTYTFTIEVENLNLDYLHLIDNMTGEDIDLLTTPSYTFESKTTDYASRFKLVFSNDDEAIGDNEAFAYFNNGNIIINQEGTLQIVDMTGRMVVSRSGRIQCIPTTGITSGVYVLRLITANGVKTQKIVVE